MTLAGVLGAGGRGGVSPPRGAGLRPLPLRRHRGRVRARADGWLRVTRVASSHLPGSTVRDRAGDVDRPRRPPSPAAGHGRSDRSRRGRRRMGLAPRQPPLFEWEPDARQAARAEAETWLAATSRPDDVLFGYEPLYLGAWERNRSFPTTVVPRADPRLALRTIERGGPARARSLGARRERPEQHPSATRDRLPAADTRGDLRGAGSSGRSS